MSSRRYTTSLKTLSLVAGAALVFAGATHVQTGAQSQPLDDGKAAFQRREDTMKRMGRPFYLGIGRVVKGTAPYGPDTVAAAKTVASLAGTLDRTLFPAGSDIADSKIKPEIFSAYDRVDQLIAAVQKSAAQLVPAVEGGNKAEIAAAYTAVANACNACHKQFRKEE